MIPALLITIKNRSYYGVLHLACQSENDNQTNKSKNQKQKL